MSKPRIFIAAHYLHLGGAEMSLIGLLQTLDYSRVEVDLFLYAHVGALMRYIPSEVHLLPEIPEYAQLENPIREVILHGYWAPAWARLRAKWKYRRWERQAHPISNNAYYQFLADEVTPTLPSLHRLGTYDLALNFIGLMNITLEKVSARRKVCWIHTDYTRMGVDVPRELPRWQQFDYIAGISEQASAAFLHVFPSLREKILPMPNILSTAFVRKRAMEFDAAAEFQEGITLLSIGRYCEAKNYDNVPDICRRIVAVHPTVHWYIIGYGGDEALIRRKIAEAGMKDHVILLGKRENVYPYIRACQLYVQPSRYEGCSVTVREAQVLAKPVVITRYATAAGQVNDGIDGVIVPLENEACADGFCRVLADEALQQRITQYLEGHDYGNTQSVETLYRLLS
jgi:glycosyltransferase involved in cell wall biosynthesis